MHTCIPCIWVNHIISPTFFWNHSFPRSCLGPLGITKIPFACQGRLARLVARNNDVTLSMVTIFWSCNCMCRSPPQTGWNHDDTRRWRINSLLFSFNNSNFLLIFLNLCEHLWRCVSEYYLSKTQGCICIFCFHSYPSICLSCISQKSSSALARLRALAHASMACDSSYFPGWKRSSMSSMIHHGSVEKLRCPKIRW